MKRLNPEELLTGSLYGIIFFPVTRFWAIPVGIVSALLYALGGMEGGAKIFRRLGVPAVQAVTLFLVTRHILVLVIGFPLAYAALSLGYGTPSGTDSGSALGRFWIRLVGANYLEADILIRGTIFVLYVLAFGIGLVL